MKTLLNIFIWILFANIALWGVPPQVWAQDMAANSSSSRQIIREAVPTIHDVRRVSASSTHSGYPVPRYVSLKYSRVNGRRGPSLKHPTLWQYQKAGLPLIVVAEMDVWRKVRDINGDESWIRTHALSGKRYAIALGDVSLHTKPKSSARIRAVAAPDALLELGECNEQGWCYVISEAGYKGWVSQHKLWGAEPL